MPQKVQIAFQGGGARFIEMLPIAHAFSLAHGRNLNVTRVAGSSAGAICAALVACNADFVRVRHFIRDNGRAKAKEMRRWCTTPAEDDWSQYVKHVVAAYTALRGDPLLKTDVLRNFLNDLFEYARFRPDPNRPNEIFDILRNLLRPNIELLITGSDLATSKGVTLNSNNLIETLVHSSAIPFAFRSFKQLSTSTIVDGGLCENLPTEELVKRQDPDGPVLCVAIAEPNENNKSKLPTNIVEYFRWLVSAPMNHNVLRAKAMAGESNVFEAKATVGTFDFEAAIEKLDDDEWYNRTREEAEDRIRTIAELYSSVVNADFETTPAHLSGRLSAPNIMRSLAQVFDNSPAANDWDYLRSDFVLRADCLKNERRKPADQIIRAATIRAKSPGLSCFASAAMMTAEKSILPTKWTCFNKTKRRNIAVHPIPVKYDDAINMMDVLIFFEDPRSSVSEGDELVVTSYFMMSNAMIALEQKGRDYIRVTNAHSVPVERSDVVLVYPSGFGRVVAVCDDFGTPITDEAKLTYLGAAHGNYVAVGHSARMLPNSKFQVNFFKES
jgi:predicted acylesterase/phospholipase RssA